MAKWTKATVCKTVIHGFESHRRLLFLIRVICKHIFSFCIVRNPGVLGHWNFPVNCVFIANVGKRLYPVFYSFFLMDAAAGDIIGIDNQ